MHPVEPVHYILLTDLLLTYYLLTYFLLQFLVQIKYSLK